MCCSTVWERKTRRQADVWLAPCYASDHSGSPGWLRGITIQDAVPPGISWNVTPAKRFRSGPPKRKGTLRRLLRWSIASVLVGWSLLALALLSLRWIDPIFTAVHIERRVQSWMHKKAYHKRYVFVGLDRISPDF